ncbi:hypothetical protein Gohar_019851 [Gossypium harknessii]|uniref:Uncharacterized protein n=1 Tax=Gossypium harknessii TaxID=34285 RepID=A0A7J9HVZ8_9ROSI|nr:hypothetical protein [Gossypium harknessii]
MLWSKQEAVEVKMLSRVPLELFTQKGLSYITSALGAPIYMNNIATLQQCLIYTQVCVEISIDFELLFINVELRDGSFVSIGVEVPWLPMHCLQCRSFSHSGKHYFKKNKVKVWRVKQDSVGTAQISVTEKSAAVRNESAPDGGAALISTFEVSSKGKAMVLDLSLTLKPKHVFLGGSSNRFEALSV